MAKTNTNSKKDPPKKHRIRTVSKKNIARSKQSSHTPSAEAIKGCKCNREKIQNFENIKDFIFLNQVVADKTLMKNVHMCYTGVTEGN